MEWNFTGNEPVYLQIMEHFRSAVLSGKYPAGSRIPPVRDLAAQARVNPNIMQRALYALEQEQLLVASGPLGRYVTQDEAVCMPCGSGRSPKRCTIALNCWAIWV